MARFLWVGLRDATSNDPFHQSHNQQPRARNPTAIIINLLSYSGSSASMHQKSLRHFFLPTFLVAIIILLMIISSCNRSSAIQPAPLQPSKIAELPVEKANTLTPTPTATQMPTTTLRSTPTPKATAAATVIPTITVPRWTLAPTLLPGPAGAAANKLLRTNGDCQLPCWFGITPGVTTWREMQSILYPFSTIEPGGRSERMIRGSVHDLTDYGVRFKIPEEKWELGAYVIDQDGVVSLIRVGAETSRKGGFTLANLLHEYGEPDLVTLDTTINVPGSQLPFRLVLYYPDKNILADYELWGKHVGDNICAYPQYTGPMLWLWSSESHFEVDGAAFPEWAISPDEIAPVPIDEVTEYDKHSFYETFKNGKYAGSICSPVDQWP